MTLGDRVVVMSGGLIQQAGTPLEVYTHPANRFVAGFIGMPAMNFIDGIISRAEVGLVFEGGGIRVPMTGALAQVADQAVGRELVLGLRPEHFSLPAESQADPARSMIELEVQVVEPLGATMDVYGRLPNNQRILVRTEAQPIPISERAHFQLATEKAHLFEPGEYGNNLNVEKTSIQA